MDLSRTKGSLAALSCGQNDTLQDTLWAQSSCRKTKALKAGYAARSGSWTALPGGNIQIRMHSPISPSSPLLSLPQLNLSLERSLHWYIATRQTMSAANRLIWKYIQDIIFWQKYTVGLAQPLRENDGAWRYRRSRTAMARDRAVSRNESVRPRGLARRKSETEQSRTIKERERTACLVSSRIISD